MEARLLIEPWAVALVAGHASRDHVIERLHACLVALEDAASDARSLAFQEADRDFHETIVAATDNRVIADFYRSLRDRQLRIGAAALFDNDHRTRSIAIEHHGIAEAIEAGDQAAAIRWVRDHVEHTRDALRLKFV
jgi:DNA-binding GntR family transcriptional regulator